MRTVKEEVANNLTFYRKKANLTQKELAEKIGVKNNTISQWEHGTNSIDIDILFNICTIFGVTINDMYGQYSNCKKQHYSSLEEQNHIQKYRTLDEKGKHTVDVVLDMEHKRCTEMTTLRIAGRDGIIEDKTVNKAEIDRALASLKGKEIKEDW